MSKKLRVGIIGAGGWGENVIHAYHQNDYVDIVAISDLNEIRSREVAKRYNVPKVYTDYKEMIKKEELDICSVATPDHAHRDAFIDCIEADLNVLLEKPFATTMEDCGAMAAAAEKTDKKFMTNYFMRWLPQFYDARQARIRGELGDIVEGYARIDDCITVPKSMLKWSDQSSPLFFVMIHNIDIVRWIIGSEAVEVYAKQQSKKLKKEGYNTPDAMQAMVTFENGASILFDSNWILPRTYDGLNDQIVRLVGTEGTTYINMTEQGLKIYRPEFSDTFEHANRGTVFMNPQYDRMTGCVERSVNHFVDCVLNDKEPAVGLDDAIEPIKIAAAIQQSISENRVIQIK